MKYFVLLTFIALLNPDGFKTDFIGEWHYTYSITGDEKLDIADEFILGTKLQFAKCDDSKELKHMPPVVIEMRKKDTVFGNISFKAFSKDGKIIDTFYPAAHSKKNKQVRFTAYGNRLKDDFVMDYSKKDTLAIHNNRIYSLNNRKYHSVQHIFIKQWTHKK